MANIIILDDEKSIVRAIEINLKAAGHMVRGFSSPLEVISAIKEKSADILLTDLKMPEMDGLELLAKVRALDSSIIVIMMTAFATVDTAVSAMKAGAFDYLVKPFEAQDIRNVISRALQVNKMRLERESLLLQLDSLQEKSPMIGRSAPMLEIMATIEKIADTGVSVLITGESGTGKELVAYSVHTKSERKKQPFISINCSAIPDTLIEAELFGHEKGAFTDARTKRLGKFELADKGTIFLDEIGDMRPDLQTKLLRFLQDQKLTRLGGSETIKVDVRVVAATNQDLKSLIGKGLFREDLYYRLAVLPIHLPPLRERGEDIALLASYFLGYFTKKHRKDAMTIDDRTMKRLLCYGWPGNVRELSNLIERAVLLSSGDKLSIAPFMIFPDGDENVQDSDALSSENCISFQDNNFPSSENCISILNNEGAILPLDHLQKQYLIRVLKEVNNNKRAAADIIGVNRSTLYRMMRRFGLELGE